MWACHSITHFSNSIFCIDLHKSVLYIYLLDAIQSRDTTQSILIPTEYLHCFHFLHTKNNSVEKKKLKHICDLNCFPGSLLLGVYIVLVYSISVLYQLMPWPGCTACDPSTSTILHDWQLYATVTRYLVMHWFRCLCGSSSSMKLCLKE